MAVWKYACKTIRGMDLDLKLLSRENLPLKITRAKSGSGNINPTKIMALTEIINPVQELQLLDVVERIDKNMVRIPIILRNTDVKEGYSMYQIGIYAEDPDLGEILYIVLQSEGEEEIPSEKEMKDFKLEWYINISISNVDKIEVVIDQTDVLTVEQGDERYASYKEFVNTKENIERSIGDHLEDNNNPHHVTKDHVGLGNVDNTSDNDKPVSTAQQEALDALFKLLQEALATHSDNKNNPHNVTKAQVGLGNADNTSDTSKPVSTAQQSAIDAAYRQSTGYTDTAIGNLINGAPETLDTLKEIADAMAENESVVDALNKAIGLKASQAELDTHTGNNTIHTTASERARWNNALASDGDTKNNSVTFTSADSASPTAWTNVGVLQSGEKHSSIFNKISTMFKNIRYLYKMLGTTDISAIGGGTVTGAIAQQNSKLEKQLGNHTVLSNVPSDAKFTDTNTWRGIQNNLTSTSTTDSLSANMGRLLASGSARDSTKMPTSFPSCTGDMSINNGQLNINRTDSSYYSHLYFKTNNKLTFSANYTDRNNGYGWMNGYGYALWSQWGDLILGSVNTGRVVVTGSLHYTGEFSNCSARRYKENIEELPLEDAIKLLKLVPVEFDYISNGLHSQGYIAEDVYEILPEIVTKNDSGDIEGVDYIRTIPYLTKLVQHQQEQIDELKRRVEELSISIQN